MKSTTSCHAALAGVNSRLHTLRLGWCNSLGHQMDQIKTNVIVKSSQHTPLPMFLLEGTTSSSCFKLSSARKIQP